jgi:hypothetical protein
MLCNKCGFEGSPNLEETGPHTKATCQKCGTYIKMVSKDELTTLINSATTTEDNETILIVKTTATESYMPDILNRVRTSIKAGYADGKGSIIKPFDDKAYPYEFYYK